MNDREKIEQFISEGMKGYPSGKYPGVTRVLSETGDKEGLKKWIESVGQEEADRILNESRVYGSSFDRLAEQFVLGNLDEDKAAEEPGFVLFNQLKPHLKQITTIGTQLKLWSDKLRVLGRPDVVGEFDDILSVIDVKNSRKTKQEKYVTDYFLQCTMYALMLKERTGVFPEQVVLLIADRSSYWPQVFKRETREFVMEAKKRLELYHVGH